MKKFHNQHNFMQIRSIIVHKLSAVQFDQQITVIVI